jgi:hypothetical protein
MFYRMLWFKFVRIVFIELPMCSNITSYLSELLWVPPPPNRNYSARLAILT